MRLAKHDFAYSDMYNLCQMIFTVASVQRMTCTTGGWRLELGRLQHLDLWDVVFHLRVREADRASRIPGSRIKTCERNQTWHQTLQLADPISPQSHSLKRPAFKTEIKICSLSYAKWHLTRLAIFRLTIMPFFLSITFTGAQVTWEWRFPWTHGCNLKIIRVEEGKKEKEKKWQFKVSLRGVVFHPGSWSKMFWGHYSENLSSF